MARRPLPSLRDLNSILVGVVSLALIGAVTAAAFGVGTLGLLENRYELTAVFPETAGLKAGHDVRVAGVKVGKVTGVDPDFTAGQVIVTFGVDHGVNLGPDTTAEIAIATVLGGHYIRLAGPVETPYLHDLPPEERRIPLSRTAVPVSVIGALDNTTRAVQALDVDTVNRLVGQLAGIASENQDAVRGVIANLQTVAAAINQRETELNALVENGQQVTETLADRDQQLALLIDQARVLLDQLSARRNDLAAILGEGSSAVTQLTDLLASHRGELDAIVGDLHATLEVVNRQLPALNSSLAWLGPTFTGLASAGSHGPWFDLVVRSLGVVSPETLELLLGPVAGGTP
ncbi:MAG: MlaD family protein [Acidimicrobiales bacterium]